MKSNESLQVFSPACQFLWCDKPTNTAPGLWLESTKSAELRSAPKMKEVHKEIAQPAYLHEQVVLSVFLPLLELIAAYQQMSMCLYYLFFQVAWGEA